MLKIAGITVKTPSELKVGRFDITKSNRAASGKMMMELIATKRRVDVVWKMLTDTELEKIIDTITANKPFFYLTYPDTGGQQDNDLLCRRYNNKFMAYEKRRQVLGRCKYRIY